MKKSRENVYNSQPRTYSRTSPSNTRESSQQPWQSFVRRWFSVVVAPLLAVGVALSVWASLPKLAIPSLYNLNSSVHQTSAISATKQTGNPHRPTSTNKASLGSAQPEVSGQEVKVSILPEGTGTKVDAALKGISAIGTGLGQNPTGNVSVQATADPLGSGLGPGGKQKTLVALGDSITFGYNLPGSAPGHPSPQAYPYLLAKGQGWRVKDLGVPGLTSEGLLSDLATVPFQRALRQANLVLLDIGSNDLLDTSSSLLRSRGAVPAAYNLDSSVHVVHAVSQLAQNLQQIVHQIKAQTAAPIILINLYDPFPDASSLHNLGEQAISAANGTIDQLAAIDGIPVADAYAVFNHHQSTLVRLRELDIHPTATGQQALAEAVNRVLQHPLEYQPMFYAISPQGTLVYTKPILGPFAMAWLHGNMGLLVTGKQGTWLQVVTPQGKQGYVAADKVTLLLRPWNDVTFASQKVEVTLGHWQQAGGGTQTYESQATGFVWQGQTYLPAPRLGPWTGGQVSYDVTRHQENLVTPLHSGLIQWNPFSTPSHPAGKKSPSPLSPLQFVPTQAASTAVTLTTTGIALNVDGEPVHLIGQPVIWQGQVYLPAAGVWTQLGGQVQSFGIRPGLSGLRLLFPNGS